MTCLSTGEDKTVLNPLDMIADFKPMVDERDRKLYKLIVDERDFTSGSASGGEVEILVNKKDLEAKELSQHKKDQMTMELVNQAYSLAL